MSDVLTFARVLAERRARVTSRSKRTRTSRRVSAPKPPRAAAIEYLGEINQILDRMRKIAERDVIPDLLKVFDPSTSPLVRTDATADRYTRQLTFLEASIQQELDEKTLRPMLRGIARKVGEHQRGELSRVLQINLRSSDVGIEPLIQSFITKNVSLIRSIASGQIEHMRATIDRATAGQLRVEDLRDELVASFGLSESRAALIARDQTLTVNSDINKVRQQQLGITSYTWSTSNDERVRGNPDGPPSDEDHFHLDGTVHTWLEPPIVNEVTGERAHPGEQIQCRCIAAPNVDEILYG